MVSRRLDDRVISFVELDRVGEEEGGDEDAVAIASSGMAKWRIGRHVVVVVESTTDVEMLVALSLARGGHESREGS